MPSIWFILSRFGHVQSINASKLFPNYAFSFLILETKTKRTALQLQIEIFFLCHCSRPPLIYPPLQLVVSTSSQHGTCVPTLAVPLTTTLDDHHGEKTQKEINLAAQAICIMDSFLELWTWNALSQPLTLTQVSAAHLSPETAHSLLKFKGPGQRVGLLHNSECSCFLCGHPCFWGCWQASCLLWGWSLRQRPNLPLTMPLTLSTSPLVLTAPS